MQKIACSCCTFMCLFLLTARAQTLDKSLGEQPWHMMETLDGFTDGHTDESYVLYEIPKDGFGLLQLNSKGQIKWKTTLKEKPFTMTRIENNIAVLTGDRTGFSAGTNNFNLLLVDPQNGKILAQKNVLNADNSTLVVPTLYALKSGKYLKVGLRYSNLSRSMKISFMGAGLRKIERDMNQINKVDILSFDKTLTLNNTQHLIFSTSGLMDGGSDIDIDGNILYAGYSPDRNDVTIYRFPDGKSAPDKQMQVAMKPRKMELIKEMKLLAGRQQGSIAYFATNYKNDEKDNVYELNRLDLNTASKLTVSDILDKRYRKELEAQPFDKFKGIRKPDVDDINDLTLTRIIEAGDKLIVCKDIQHVDFPGTSGTAMYVGGNGIISVYDAGMKKQYERIIPKKYKSYLSYGLGIDLHARDGQAYFVTNDSEGGYMKAEVLFGKIDINSGNFSFIEHLEKDEIGKAEPSDTKNIIWFTDKLIVSYMKLKGMLSAAYTNTPVMYQY